MNQKGLTYVEVLIVLAIIGIFALLATPSIIKALNVARVKAAEMELDHIDSALGLYSSANQGRFPPDLDTLLKEKYLKNKKSMNDPFNRPYQYSSLSEGSEYILFSSGPDGAKGTSDDLFSPNSSR